MHDVWRRTLGLVCAFMCVHGMAGPMLVTEVHGSARTGQGALVLLDQVGPGTALELGAGAVLVLFAPEQAQQFRLAGPGHFVTGVNDVVLRGVGGSVRVLHQDAAFAGVLRGRDQVAAGAVVRAGSDAAPERIALAQPVLSWRARPHRGAWQLRLTDGAGQVLFATTLAETAFTLPPSVPLQPSQQYGVELRWEDRDGAVQVALTPLETLGAAEEAQVARLMPPADADPATRVLYALYLRSLGLHGLPARIAPELNQLDLPP